MININHVSMAFGRSVAVRDATLNIPAGDSVALWGPNGAGKTTLIRCVLGLLRFRGSISLAGRDVRRDGKRARLLVGYVPQELGFHDELGVNEALRFFAALKGLEDVDPHATLEHVGLAGHGGKRVRELSGGMKQRLALAIALLGNPPVLVLDEVTASLDAVGRAEFVGLLERLSGAGRTLLFASHRLDEVATLARRVVELEQGRIRGITPAAAFVSGSEHGAVLHLHIAAPARHEAVRFLAQGGFAAKLNGVGLLVPVAPSQKAAPFRVLAEAGISVDDFEVVTSAHASDLATRARERRETQP